MVYQIWMWVFNYRKLNQHESKRKSKHLMHQDDFENPSDSLKKILEKRKHLIFFFEKRNIKCLER